MRRTVAAVRPAGEGPQSAENTVYSTFASRNYVPVPNPGIPIVPIPGYWYASVNGWHVQVKGEYARFEVSARTDDPSSPKPTTYVRAEQPVYLQVKGLERRAGTIESLSFENDIEVAVLMPGQQAYPAGSWGTGDRFKVTPNSKHELSECTVSWDYVGPGFNPLATTSTGDPATNAGTANDCGNKGSASSGPGGETVDLLADASQEGTAEALADFAEDRVEDELAPETCLPGEDDDHVIGPGAGSGLPGAPPANAGYVGSDDAHIHAIDTSDVTGRWQFETARYIDASPAAADGTLFVTGDDCLYALREA